MSNLQINDRPRSMRDSGVQVQREAMLGKIHMARLVKYTAGRQELEVTRARDGGRGGRE